MSFSMYRIAATGAFLALSVAAFSCGGSGGDEPAAPAPTPRAEGMVSISGTLNLSLNLSAAATTQRVLLFSLEKGTVTQAPKVVDVTADGTFSVAVPKAGETRTKLEQALAGTTIDRAAVKALLPEHASEIDSMPEGELRTELETILADSVIPTYLLVAMEASGDKVAEADSFRFIGMPTGGENLLNLPVDSLKGDLALGTISESGDEAVSTKVADGTNFNLSSTAIEELATLSDALKSVKNYWMNTDAQGRAPVEITPFFMWKQTSLENVENKFIAPSAPEFTGTGFYLKVRDVGVGFGDICPASLTGQTPLTFVPPAVITTANGERSPTSPFSNAGTLTRSEQYDGIACGGSGGFYVRNDEPGNEANRNLMVNWGGIEGILPAGYWKLKVSGITKGTFDLKASFPLDANGKPKVYIPAFRVVTSGGIIQQVDAKFYLYDQDAATFLQVTDATALDKIVHSIGIDISYTGGAAKPDDHINAEPDATTGSVFKDGMVSFPLSAEQKTLLRGSDSAQHLGYLGMSYGIGPNSYRMELRPNEN